MYKKLLGVVVIAIALIFTLSACGPNDEPQNLEGVWGMVGGAKSFDMTARIEDDRIVIMWLSDDAEALYWAGDFDSADAVSDGEQITSFGDTELMDQSLLGSGDSAKVFGYNDKTLSFKMTVTGVTKTIYLKK